MFFPYKGAHCSQAPVVALNLEQLGVRVLASYLSTKNEIWLELVQTLQEPLSVEFLLKPQRESTGMGLFL